MAEFNLQEIYFHIASYKGLPYPIGINKLPSYKIKQFQDRASLIKGDRDIRDIQGRPVVVPAVLGGIELGSSKADHIMIQPLVLIEGRKDIVKTTLEGSEYPGTAKEFISYDDYKLKIYGALVNRNQKEYPYEQLEVLKSVWKRNESLLFECVVTDDLFTYIVVEKLKLHELTKSPGIQMYEIEALSDANIEVEFLNQDGS